MGGFSHERRSVRCGFLACAILLVALFGNPAAAQQSQNTGNASTTTVSLPDAPDYIPPDRAPLGANGAPEGSNAPPQLRQTIEDQSDDQANPAFISKHMIADRFWISGQSNFIFQAHTPFHAPYSGPNSFHSFGEDALSRTLTLFTAVKLFRFTNIVATVDETGGRGLSDGNGIAAYVNADVIAPNLSRSVYLSRAFYTHMTPLTADRISEDPNPFVLQSSIPRRRLEFTIGKLNLLDFFDVNEVGSDPHLQFTNLAIGNTGTYENGADGHGETIAVMLNYQGPKVGIRFAEALLPKFTGSDLNYDIGNTRSENLQLDYSDYALQGYGTHLRALFFVNRATLGNYREANQAYLNGQNATPDITLHRHEGTVKPGFAINFEQDLPRNFRVYLRTGWNDGAYESFTFSEMNNTITAGGDLSGDVWHRKDDRIGSAFVNSGLAHDHREYLALGGIGFMLGDGGLTYGRETVSETYYTAHVFGGLYAAAQISFVNNPGFNRARGPVIVPGLRAHIDF
jgi:high affinity Mn2+ porin